MIKLGILIGNPVFGLKTEKPVLFLWQPVFEFVSFFSRKLHKNYQISDKINSHIHLMLSVYKSFQETVKYGKPRNQILQDLTGIKI